VWLKKAFPDRFTPFEKGGSGGAVVKVGGKEVRGRLDGEFIEDDGEVSVVDIKSISPDGFNRVEKEGPESDHRAQMTSYMKARGRKSARIIYYNKKNSALAEFKFFFESGVWEWIESDFRIVETGELPPKPYEPAVEREWIQGFKRLGERDASVDIEGFTVGEVKKTGYYRETGRRILEFPCSYCAFKVPCQGPLHLEIIGGKPRFVVGEGGSAEEAEVALMRGLGEFE